MTPSLNPLKTTLLGGLLFLLPLIVVLTVAGKAMALLLDIAEPLFARLPHADLGGIALASLLAAVLLLGLCFGAGLLARATFARALSETFENRLHALYPRYTVIKAMTQGLDERSGPDAMQPVLVTFDDHQMLAMEVERTADGRTVVFLPGAPDPWSGSVVLVAPDRVSPVAAELSALNRSLKRLGRGSAALLGPDA